MERREARARVEHDRAELEERHGPRRRVLLEVGADQVLEHQERGALGDAAIDDVGDVGVVEAGEGVGLLDERGEDAFALDVGGVGQGVGLGILSTKSRSLPGFLTSHTEPTPPSPSGLHELVALDELGLLLPRAGRRRRRAADGAPDRRLEQGRGHGPERREPHVEHRQLARAHGAGDQRGDARRVGRGLGRERLGGGEVGSGERLSPGRRARPGAARRPAPARSTSPRGSGFDPAASSKASSVSARPARARASSVSSAWRAWQRLFGDPGPAGVGPARRTRRSESPRPARSSARAPPSAIIGSAVASWRSIAGRSMTSAHHAANGPSHRTSSTSPRAVPRVMSTSRQKSVLSAALQRRRELARAVGQPLELAQPEAGVVRRRPAALARARRPRRRRRARSRRGGWRGPRAGVGRGSAPRRGAARPRRRGSRRGRARASSTSLRGRAGRPDWRRRPRGALTGRVASSGAQRRSANARAALSSAFIAAARWRTRPAPSARRRASRNVGPRARRSAPRGRRPLRRRTGRRAG